MEKREEWKGGGQKGDEGFVYEPSSKRGPKSFMLPRYNKHVDDTEAEAE